MSTRAACGDDGGGGEVEVDTSKVLACEELRDFLLDVQEDFESSDGVNDLEDWLRRMDSIRALAQDSPDEDFVAAINEWAIPSSSLVLGSARSPTNATATATTGVADVGDKGAPQDKLHDPRYIRAGQASRNRSIKPAAGPNP